MGHREVSVMDSHILNCYLIGFLPDATGSVFDGKGNNAHRFTFWRQNSTIHAASSLAAGHIQRGLC